MRRSVAAGNADTAAQRALREKAAAALQARIAQAATEAGFGVVCLSRPALSEGVASIESIR